MTTVQTLTILLFATLLLDSCSQRDDILLSASDELHYIKLFDKDSEFELCHNGFNRAVGKYEFKDDTVYLTYTGKENEFLTRKLIIDSATKRIHSADERNFCAFISSNKLKSK
ncbi:MAG: hypothetical protein EOO07_35470 [Chitinophagaceae bacterium]|nr:MAG: hypothetical protein EOO07_35470 [Chitinophagaceae bacterium]